MFVRSATVFLELSNLHLSDSGLSFLFVLSQDSTIHLSSLFLLPRKDRS